MIVRRRHARLVVDMGEDLKPELGILVEQLEPARHAFAAIFLDEILVGKQSLEPRAHLLPAAWPGIALEDEAAIGDELIEIIGHSVSSRNLFRPASRIASRSTRAVRPGHAHPSRRAVLRWPCPVPGRLRRRAQP